MARVMSSSVTLTSASSWSSSNKKATCRTRAMLNVVGRLIGWVTAMDELRWCNAENDFGTEFWLFAIEIFDFLRALEYLFGAWGRFKFGFEPADGSVAGSWSQQARPDFFWTCCHLSSEASMPAGCKTTTGRCGISIGKSSKTQNEHYVHEFRG